MTRIEEKIAKRKLKHHTKGASHRFKILFFSTLVILGIVGLIGMLSAISPKFANAAQGRPQPIEDGYQTTLKGPGQSAIEVYCYRGEVIYRSVLSDASGVSVALQAPGPAAACGY